MEFRSVLSLSPMRRGSGYAFRASNEEKGVEGANRPTMVIRAHSSLLLPIHVSTSVVARSCARFLDGTGSASACRDHRSHKGTF